jgi:tripartite-type tricarboxylate transporter receptor subunit TctC
MTYVPYKGGGDAGATRRQARRLDGEQPDRGGGALAFRRAPPLCVFDNAPMPYLMKVTTTQSWQDILTCKSQGIDMEYLMLRGIFMAPGVTRNRSTTSSMCSKVRELPEWKVYREAANNTFMTGKQYADWVAKAEGELGR